MNRSIIYLPVESLNTRKRFLLLDVGRVCPEDRWKRRAKEDRQHREVPRLVHEVLDAKAFVVNFDSFSVAGDQLPVGGESDDVIELSEYWCCYMLLKGSFILHKNHRIDSIES